MTPTSVSNLWLHYEAGCAATKGVAIVPIVAGISVNDVRPPLSLYNAYNVAQPEGLKAFLMRLYHQHGIQHDELMLEAPILNAVREITAAVGWLSEAGSSEQDGNDKVLRLLDRRFMELFDRLPQNAAHSQAPTFNVSAVVTKKGKTLTRVTLDISDKAASRMWPMPCTLSLRIM